MSATKQDTSYDTTALLPRRLSVIGARKNLNFPSSTISETGTVALDQSEPQLLDSPEPPELAGGTIDMASAKFITLHQAAK